ncbi:MAG TPA: MipA/OmpV family protein, partial [Gammaproteobacteria bacterium]
MFKNMKYFAMKFLLVIFWMLTTTSLFAEQNTGYWELGAGVSYIQSPHYAGSNQSKNYVVPFPHVVIKTDYLSVDRNVLRGHVLSTDTFRFNVSFSGSFKVESEDNELRRGMPDLDYIIEAGPSLQWLLSGNFGGKRYVTIEVPVRGAIATDFDEAKSIGWHAIPTLHWHNEWHNDTAWKL